jgi:hypothetical protein
MIVLWTRPVQLKNRDQKVSAASQVGLRMKARQIHEGFGRLIGSPGLVAILVLTVLVVVFILPIRA